MLLQILITLFFLFALSRVFLRYRDGVLGVMGLVGWSIFWIFLELIIVHPQTTTLLAKILGVGRGVDAVIYLAIIILFYVLFRIGVKVEFIEHEITQIVRKLALREHHRE